MGNSYTVMSDIFNKITTDTKVNTADNNIRNPAYYFSQLLINSPHLLLMYDISLDYNKENNSNNIYFKLDETIAASIWYSTIEYFGNIGVKSIFNPNNANIARLFGFNEDDIDSGTIKSLLNITKKYGIPESVLQDSIGKLILNNLGIKSNDNGLEGYYEKVASGLGTFALMFLEEKGIVKIKTWEKEKFNTADGNNLYSFLSANSIRCVSLNPDFNAKEFSILFKGNNKQGVLDSYKIINKHETRPSTKPITELEQDIDSKEGIVFRSVREVKNTINLMNVPKLITGLMSRLEKTPFVLNQPMIEYVFNNREDIKHRLGWVPTEAMENM